MIDVNIISLFIRVSFLAKLILLLLIFFSIISWAIIIHHIFVIKLTNYKIKKFKKLFCSGIEFIKLYQDRLKYRNTLTGLERIFCSGFSEFSRLERLQNVSVERVINGTSRVMCISINLELAILNNNITLLGTIGSISPYIGLLGTVWGLIHSFNKLGNVKYITLQEIAPGITEALLSTAIGLFASIPAVIAFNHLNFSIGKIEEIFHNFMEEFIAILYRQVLDNFRLHNKKNSNNELPQIKM
ncbi:protein TolQ [Blochmannia endosymbiont of Camponotus (Colobopsis) obliquus]|uniref:protein TolQ n=1 Tax=Blochmannia endosymbiont of Camponotus (Colobopsis) obliquus TaxID=1505597 RepID=UPI00061A795D|nr:protein TolQ [Blochmannia endosymbiont of Camponotus (Colobopsis) obliquus]AKC60499.1 protein TolQ [Blochmannia endosymbiont of Camponotus (Colobopsis) obliquus]